MSDIFVRFRKTDGSVGYGQKSESTINVFSQAPWMDGKATGEEIPVQQVNLLAPVEPGKIICIGLNYHAHVKASYSADEAPENPLLFMKPPSSVIGPGDNIVHPPQSERVDYEAELGFVIGKICRNVKQSDADKYIFGFTCVNDVTARDLQKKDGQWTRAKGFDTFCPVGPHIVTEYDYRNVLIEGVVNGEVIQSGRTELMIFKIPYLIEYISSVMTLMPGDLISTGTPAKIAPMNKGDEIEVRIERLGSLKNKMA